MYNTAPRRRCCSRPAAQRIAGERRAPTRRTESSQATSRSGERQNKKMSKERSDILEVMPPELLDQLTKDELILQSIIQLDALDGPGKETVFWI